MCSCFRTAWWIRWISCPTWILPNWQHHHQVAAAVLVGAIASTVTWVLVEACAPTALTMTCCRCSTKQPPHGQVSHHILSNPVMTQLTCRGMTDSKPKKYSLISLSLSLNWNGDESNVQIDGGPVVHTTPLRRRKKFFRSEKNTTEKIVLTRRGRRHVHQDVRKLGERLRKIQQTEWLFILPSTRTKRTMKGRT